LNPRGSTGTFSADGGTLDLDSGASFTAANSLDLFGLINLKGGTFSGQTITSHAFLRGGSTSGKLTKGTVFGNGTSPKGAGYEDAP
jgi:hypothetical protein